MITSHRCWETIDKQCLDYNHPGAPSSSVTSQGWKVVRLFVSSTFNDYQNERTFLVKKVCEVQLSQLIRAQTVRTALSYPNVGFYREIIKLSLCFQLLWLVRVSAFPPKKVSWVRGWAKFIFEGQSY